jgi:hypothetical protein
VAEGEGGANNPGLPPGPLPGVPVPPPPPPDHPELDLGGPRAPKRASEPPVAGLRPDGNGGYQYKDSNFSAHIAHDGTVELSSKGPVGLGGEAADGNRAMFSWDLNDLVTSAGGSDPYGSDKSRFLESTRTLRNKLCDEAQKERLHQSLFELKEELEKIWGSAQESALRRRAQLFELWDTCAEDGGADVLRAGAMARATILSFIRAHLPETAKDGYGVDELIALNSRRRSKEPFAPYRP